MSSQMLNERTFTDAPTLQEVDARTMALSGVIVKALFLIALTMAFGVIGWDWAASRIGVASGPSWILGYIVLIALSVATVRNPKLAPVLGIVYAVLMGLWMGSISRIFEEAYVTRTARIR
jgi:uncharacterized YccA/Bax inhibitor family protein